MKYIYRDSRRRKSALAHHLSEDDFVNLISSLHPAGSEEQFSERILNNEVHRTIKTIITNSPFLII